MSEFLDPQLQVSANRLLKWEARRRKLAKLLGGFDLDEVVFADTQRQRDGHGTAPMTDFIRAIPSVLSIMAVELASNSFCEAAESAIGAEVLPASTAPGGHALDGRAFEPVIMFPNGLMLKSVAAARHVVSMSELPS